MRKVNGMSEERIEEASPEKVLAWLREKGWRKGSMGTVDGPNCLNGAMFYLCAIEYSEFSWEIPPASRYREIYELISQIIYEQYDCTLIPVFNDNKSTEWEDVERVLEKAAIRWEETRALSD